MNLSIVGDKLLIELEWYEQFWALTLNKTFEIPLNHIKRVTTAQPQSNWAEIRAPGTFLPGVIKAGTYYTRNGREFWYVTQDKDYLVLELEDEPFKKMVLTISQSEAWLERIERQI
ncbi:MAG TPA: hypothetical protein DDW76_01725 [Cyanobacteria bacterium UBA11369]|nr:hypothetical protein [Cyanobacteria bacterium UBA11371]HBE35950.1 hypothetical protein [Cyanobacteria bacterium UBA11368]HBE47550.1 hypothetical protein [Cyanobacteria bacterium UBA11369]